ncbi:MAG: energy-coupling factor ABC transporter ATP-binding protein [Candidatus Promineifilaceae bacterium]
MAGTNNQGISPEPAVFEASGVGFHYEAQHPVLDGVSIAIAEGEKVGLIGPNGAGKTTLFMLACGVLKPTSGTLSLFGQPVTAGQFRPEIGMVFQNSDDQLFSPTVWDDVAFGPQNLGLAEDDVAQRVDEVLTQTGTLALAKRPPHHLSGGEKRMVSIAGVLAMLPRFVILDEPTASLDIRARRRLIAFLQGAGETILFSSHDLEFILEVCDRVILLDNGQVVASGDPHQIMSDKALMEAHGLERPHSLTHHVDPHHEQKGEEAEARGNDH